MHVEGKRKEGHSEEFNKWQERLLKYNEWIESSQLRSAKVGDIVDACDTEYIWCKAQIEIIIKTQSHKDLLYIHY